VEAFGLLMDYLFILAAISKLAARLINKTFTFKA
jgi:hypothetical protein